MHPIVTAQVHIESLNLGSSRPQLFADENLNQWVVKSVHSFQGTHTGRMLFNEYVATRIAETIGMPVYPVAAMSVSAGIMNAYPHLASKEFGSFTPGLHFASAFHTGYPLAHFVQSQRLDLVQKNTTNRMDANAVMAFDSWAFNCDRAVDQQVQVNGAAVNQHLENHGNLHFEKIMSGLYRMVMIDHGLAFFGSWHDDPSLAPHARLGNWGHLLLGNMEIFFKNQWANLIECMAWVQKLQTLTLAHLQSIASEVPTVWRSGISDAEIHNLLIYLEERAYQIGHILVARLRDTRHVTKLKV
jgi:hypothetical protein